MTGKVRFGPFEADLRIQELRKNGLKVHLCGHPFAVLTELLKHHGEVVTREEIQRILWPESVHIDFEHSLNTAIKKLRQALDDNASKPRFVETMPRRGYRFIFPIQELREDDQELSDKRSLAFIPGLRRHAWLVVLGFVTLSAWFFVRSMDPADPELSVAPLTSYLGCETNPALSPDGTMIAFAWNQDDNNDHIFVRQIGGGEPHRLSDSASRELSPAWSPDGRNVAFLRESAPGKADVVVSPFLGESERLVGEVLLPRGGSVLAEAAGPFLAWSPEGDALIVTQAESEAGPAGLFRMSITSGGMHRLTTAPRGNGADCAPAFSPDGHTLAFTRFGEAGVGDVFLLSIPRKAGTADQPVRLTAGDALYRTPTWMTDGRRLVVARGCCGASSLWTVSVPDRKLSGPLLHSGSSAEQPTVARQADRLVYVASRLRADVFRHSLWPSGVQTEKLISSTRLDTSAVYSPHGDRIAFLSNRTGTLELWVCQEDGSHPVQVTRFGGSFLGAPSWSPDGESIAIDVRNSGGSDIFIVDPLGQRVRRLTTTEISETSPFWSSDGKWVFFSTAGTGHVQLWRAPAAGGDSEMVNLPAGIVQPHSAVGRLMHFGPQAGTPVPIDPRDRGPSVNTDGFVAPDGRLVILQAAFQGKDATISLLDPKRRTAVELLRVRDLAPGVSVSPDGRYLLFSRFADAESDLMLVELAQ